MTQPEYKKLYRRLYRLFDGCTPLPQDCGAVCGAACCKGDDATGMLLFPGEETSLTVIEADGRRLAVCTGACDRTQRPLACRIFPFFPVLTETGRVRAVPDPRALTVCPLARQAPHVRFSRRFLRRVKKAGRLLAKDPACRAFLTELSAELADLSAAAERLKNN